MMKKLFTLILLGAALGANAQNVGINTNSPKATLDVVGAPATPGTPDGIIPPKLTRAQLIAKTGYGTDQIGAVVYVTDLSGTINTATNNVVQTGLYTFDGTKWNSTRPKILGFSATKTNSHDVDNGNQVVVYNVNDTNIDGSGWYSTSTGRFTPKVAGYYQFNAGLRIYVAGVTAERNLSLHKNGSVLIPGYSMIGATATQITASGMIYLNGTTDFVTVSVYSAGNNGSLSNTASNAYFQGFLIGQ